MKQSIYNPDVLSCIANLSNDEVFTPPQVANRMLDMLPNDLWSDKDAKFLDPVSKTGVFLREIARRLNEGLEQQIPDRQERLNHIFSSQLYGIAITDLTALLSRRSLYCSKKANGEFSVAQVFNDEKGNILFDRINHTWDKGNCKYCGASEDVYSREKDLESHAYQFIHTENPEKICNNMKFDVIIGNPPYQLNDGGSGNGISAKPLYHEFVRQAKKLSPRYLVMIIPSRWFAGGKGLDSFREEMIKDKRIRQIVDFPKSRDCFPGVDIAGGVCYFLWDRKFSGDCNFSSITGGRTISETRRLDEFEILIRDNKGIEIVRRIVEGKNKMFSDLVYARNPFGFVSSERGKAQRFDSAITLHSSGGKGFVKTTDVKKNSHIIDDFKVVIGKVNPDRGGVNNASDGKMSVITKVKILEPKEVITETYILLASFKNREHAENCASFFRSKLVRYLLSLTLTSMNISRDNFQFIPALAFEESWNDEKLYKRYSLTQEEIDHIESVIRPMD